MIDIGALGLEKNIEDDFIRTMESIGEEDPYASNDTLGIFDVLKAHYLIANFFLNEGEGIGGIGPRDIGLLHSALFRQFAGFGGERKWNSLFDIAATLMFGLIKNHAFYDANKRTAFLSTLYFLYKNGYTPSVTQKEFEDFTVDIADNRIRKFRSYKKFERKDPYDADIYIISQNLKSKMRKIDNRYYTVTYRELNKILKSFDCYLDNPSGNKINVMKTIKVRKGILKKRYEEETHRVAQIGFPSWTAQVGKGAINTVRKETGLTPENGIDSQTFFKGLDAVEELIAHYQDPLRRLAFR